MNADILWLVVACAAEATAQNEEPDSRTVHTAQGPVRGYKSDNVFEFFGIPYATAPTGPNKFKAPLPAPVWMNPFEATNHKITCPQTPLLDLTDYNMGENCLVANIFTPDTDKRNLSVLVFVHGGGYQLGWGDMYKMNALVKTKKIIAVTFNYRLGIHGFLCLGTETAPGNAGMKDQVALLRWVNKNIGNFGGNPNDVTIAGSHAGGSSVDLLMLSKMTKGLYSKVIAESGANVGVWSVQLDPVENAKDFARTNNYTNVDNIHGLEEFYKTALFEVLTSNTFSDRTDSSFVFSPCVERDINEETFLEDSPVNILKQGKYKKVPILYGFANMEGMHRIREFETWRVKMNKRFSDFLPADLIFKSEKKKAKVAQRIKKFYFEDDPVSNEAVIGYVDYFTDVMFAYPHLRSTQLQVEAGSNSTYLYQYSFYTPHGKSVEIPAFMDNLRGAGPCAQTLAVYDFRFDYDENKSQEYLEMREKMRELWLNFITTGKPVPEGSKFPAWPPVGANRSPYMDLGNEIKLKGPLLESRARFWDEIYKRFYRFPVPPMHNDLHDE